ncbi:MAG TPA: T9SS type A sorting domain-containing protein [Saprospiraceae bacterium]|nr:T9SS type A sorting domain-containing protein [Saprospiraceae bacterium]
MNRDYVNFLCLVSSTSRLIQSIAFVTCLISFQLNLEAQILQWAGGIGGTGKQKGESVVSDAAGFVYTIGSYDGTVDFDPGPGVLDLDSRGGSDVFVTKMDSDGTLIWAKSIGGFWTQAGYGVTLDSGGNVYVTGLSIGTCDYDPGPEIFNLTSEGTLNCFICKLNDSGDFIWARLINGPGQSVGRDIVIDEDQNVYMIGEFQSTMDFDPGANLFEMTSGIFSDVFILKVDVDGNFIWAKQLGGINYDFGYSIHLSSTGHLYATGSFLGESDFDPGPGVFNLTSMGGEDVFITKLNTDGEFVWAKRIGSALTENVSSITGDESENLYITGEFQWTVDFNPDTSIYSLNSAGSLDVYVVKLSKDGDLIWARSMGSPGIEYAFDIDLDRKGGVYVSGSFEETIEFVSNLAIYNLISGGESDAFIAKWDSDGYFVWAIGMGGTAKDESHGCTADDVGNVYTTGYFDNVVDFDPGPNSVILISGGSQDIFIAKYSQSGISGSVFNDISQDCEYQTDEPGLWNRLGLIQPGNFIVETNLYGSWYHDSLPIGSYTITFDTAGKWKATCPTTVEFAVTDPDSLTVISPFGLVSTEPCAQPSVSVFAPSLRRCFSDQRLYAEACNLHAASGALSDAYVELQLDSFFTITGASITYLDLGNHAYQFDVGTLNPGECFDFWVDFTLSCSAILGQTLCAEANLYPADSCVFESGSITSPGAPPCALIWDRSSVTVEGWCENDNIHFEISNTGESGSGDMQCYSSVHRYIDGMYIRKDSIRLRGGKSDTLVFAGDGRTWRLNVDQHPQHPGRSNPGATVELCGNSENWTSGLYSILPHDDVNPVVDIYCGEVTGSRDPNDKTGFPLGVGDSHNVSPNGKMDYVIRFQNKGNDTAFTVVIRDTLDTDLNIFTARPGVASHNYIFRMYGPRVMEWTFNNIMLPDSAVDQEGSNGFVTFTIEQNKDLADGTEFTNSAAIYFDFNDPVITNSTLHSVGRMINSTSWTETKELFLEDCDMITYNELIYANSGTYWQIVEGGINADTLVTLHVVIPSDVNMSITQIGAAFSTSIIGADYQWINCADNTPLINETDQSFTATVSGSYAVIVTQNGCIDTSACYTINLVGTVDNSFENSLSIYPNPTRETVTLDFDAQQSVIDVLVFNMLGKMIAQKQHRNSSVMNIDVSGEPGIYVLHIKVSNGTATIRLVKY